MRRLLACAWLIACGGAPRAPETVPPPAQPASACASAGLETHEGDFSLLYGDPPAGQQRPRILYSLAAANRPTLTLLIDDALLQPYEAGRALDGRRVTVTGQAVPNQPHTLRVCSVAAR